MVYTLVDISTHQSESMWILHVTAYFSNEYRIYLESNEKRMKDSVIFS